MQKCTKIEVGVPRRIVVSKYMREIEKAREALGADKPTIMAERSFLVDMVSSAGKQTSGNAGLFKSMLEWRNSKMSGSVWMSEHAASTLSFRLANMANLDEKRFWSQRQYEAAHRIFLDAYYNSMLTPNDALQQKNRSRPKIKEIAKNAFRKSIRPALLAALVAFGAFLLEGDVAGKPPIEKQPLTEKIGEKIVRVEMPAGEKTAPLEMAAVEKTKASPAREKKVFQKEMKTKTAEEEKTASKDTVSNAALSAQINAPAPVFDIIPEISLVEQISGRTLHKEEKLQNALRISNLLMQSEGACVELPEDICKSIGSGQLHVECIDVDDTNVYYAVTKADSSGNVLDGRIIKARKNAPTKN